MIIKENTGKNQIIINLNDENKSKAEVLKRGIWFLWYLLKLIK